MESPRQRRLRILEKIDSAKAELLHAAMCHGWRRCPRRLSRAAIAYSKLLDAHLAAIPENRGRR